MAATLNELAGRADSRQEELSRMTRMGKTYQQDHLKLAARARHSALLRPSSASSSSAATTADPGPATQESAASEHATSRAASSSKNGSRTEGMVFASGPVEGDPWGVCDVCREEVPNMRCSGCQRWIHAVCCSPAALSPVDFPPNVEWKCQACGESNKVTVPVLESPRVYCYIQLCGYNMCMHFQRVQMTVSLPACKNPRSWAQTH